MTQITLIQEQLDRIFLDELIDIYKCQVNEIRSIKHQYKNNIPAHKQEDLRLSKEIKKATKRLIAYYTTHSEFNEVMENIKNG